MVRVCVGYLLVISGLVVGIVFGCCSCLLTLLLVSWLCCLWVLGSACVVLGVFNVAYFLGALLLLSFVRFVVGVV